MTSPFSKGLTMLDGAMRVTLKADFTSDSTSDEHAEDAKTIPPSLAGSFSDTGKTYYTVPGFLFSR